MKNLTFCLLSIILLIGAIVIFQAEEAESSIIPERAKRFVESVENTAENIIENVAEKIGFASEKTKEKAAEASEVVKEKSFESKEQLREDATFAKEKVDNYADQVRRNTDTVMDNFKEKARDTKEKLGNAKEKVETYAEGVKENIKEKAQNVKEGAENLAGNVKRNAKNAKEKVEEVAGDVKEEASNFAGEMKEKVGIAKDKIVDVAENVAEKVLPQEVIDMVDPISETIQGGVLKAKEKLSKLANYKDKIIRKLFPTDEDYSLEKVNEQDLIVKWAKRNGFEEIVPVLISKNYDLEKLGTINTSNIQDEFNISDRSYSLRIIDAIDDLFDNVEDEKFKTTSDFVTPVDQIIL